MTAPQALTELRERLVERQERLLLSPNQQDRWDGYYFAVQRAIMDLDDLLGQVGEEKKSEES